MVPQRCPGPGTVVTTVPGSLYSPTKCKLYKELERDGVDSTVAYARTTDRRQLVGDTILVIVSIVIGGFRVAGYKSEFYQGIAHIYVGALLGAAIVANRYLYWTLFTLLTILEVLCFIVFAMLSH